jgi:hypothetical protein
MDALGQRLHKQTSVKLNQLPHCQCSSLLVCLCCLQIPSQQPPSPNCSSTMAIKAVITNSTGFPATWQAFAALAQQQVASFASRPAQPLCPSCPQFQPQQSQSTDLQALHIKYGRTPVVIVVALRCDPCTSSRTRHTGRQPRPSSLGTRLKDASIRITSMKHSSGLVLAKEPQPRQQVWTCPITM